MKSQIHTFLFIAGEVLSSWLIWELIGGLGVYCNKRNRQIPMEDSTSSGVVHLWCVSQEPLFHDC